MLDSNELYTDSILKSIRSDPTPNEFGNMAPLKLKFDVITAKNEAFEGAQTINIDIRLKSGYGSHANTQNRDFEGHILL